MAVLHNEFGILFVIILFQLVNHYSETKSHAKWAVSLMIVDGHFDLPQRFVWVCTGLHIHSITPSLFVLHSHKTSNIKHVIRVHVMPQHLVHLKTLIPQSYSVHSTSLGVQLTSQSIPTSCCNIVTRKTYNATHTYHNTPILHCIVL